MSDGPQYGEQPGEGQLPPPPPGQAPYGQAPYAGQQYGQAPYGQAPYGQNQWGGVPVRNQKALISMILGIVGLFICGLILGIVAIILAQIAKREIAESGGSQTGSGMATTGLITGIVGVVGWIILIYIRFHNA